MSMYIMRITIIWGSIVAYWVRLLPMTVAFHTGAGSVLVLAAPLPSQHPVSGFRKVATDQLNIPSLCNTRFSPFVATMP